MRHLREVGRRILRPGRRRLSALSVLAALLGGTAFCTTPEPKALLKVTDIETYWILDPSRTEKRLLAPVVRFRVENISSEELISVDATAAFRRDGSVQPWGSGFMRLTEGRKRIKPGASVLVTMDSDARYTTEGTPGNAFTNPGFKSVNVEFFLKVGRSVWVPFGRASVEDVLGSKEARATLAHPN